MILWKQALFFPALLAELWGKKLFYTSEIINFVGRSLNKTSKQADKHFNKELPNFIKP